MPQTNDTVLIRKGNTRTEHPAREFAPQYAESAALSAAVYKAPNDSQRLLDVVFLTKAGWRHWHDAPVIKQPEGLRILIEGLSYEIWEKRLSENQLVIALVFRGSDGPDDWWTNFRWVTRYVPFTQDQYEQVKYLVPLLVQAIQQFHAGKNLSFIAAGHSLGGGLAQQAAYISDRIKEVYAFDSSPVTGFQTTPNPPRDTNAKGIKIFRVYEKGEVLSPARTLLRQFMPLSLQDPEITEARFNFSAGENSVEEHSIQVLAKNLREASNTAG